jgi:hypothetical protein
MDDIRVSGGTGKESTKNLRKVEFFDGGTRIRSCRAAFLFWIVIFAGPTKPKNRNGIQNDIRTEILGSSFPNYNKYHSPAGSFDSNN